MKGWRWGGKALSVTVVEVEGGGVFRAEVGR